MARNFWASLACLVLSGCLVGPDYHPPQAPTTQAWSGLTEVSATQPAMPTTRPVDLSEWWQNFNDRILDSLIERAADANPSLQLAEARVREARALRDIAVADFWPQINLGTSYSFRGSSQNASPRQSTGGGNGLLSNALRGFSVRPGQFDPATNTFGPPTLNLPNQGNGGQGNAISLSDLVNRGNTSAPRPQRWQNLFQLGFDASWELDFFGRIRRAVEAAEADLAAADEARRDVLVILMGDVALNYAQLRGFQRQLFIAHENIRAQQDTLDLTESRFQAGLTNELDLSQQRAQLETTRSQVPAFETAIRQTIYQLSVLLGRPPGALVDELSPMAEIPKPPSEIPIGLPADLLRRRPDIRQAERLVAAVTARIGVATAELFPQIALTGSFGTQSAEMKNFLDNRSLFWSVGPSVQWPIFEGGRIRANIRAEEAREEQALAQYIDVVLTALQDVENSLFAYTQERTRRESLTSVVIASRRATELSRELYTRGLGPFLNVLESERTLYAAEDELVQSETAVTTNLIALYKALGGGWERTETAR